MGKVFSSLFGRTYDSIYTLSQDLANHVDTLEWQLLQETVASDLIHVDLGVEVPRNRFNHKYTIKFNHQLDHGCQICLLFPTHPQPKYRRLYTSSYTSFHELQKEINRRLTDSRTTKHLVMGVACQKTLFVFERVEGTVYLVWASAVNRVTVNHQEAKVAENVPLLVEMDKFGKYRSLFMFPHDSDYEERDTQMQCLRIADCTMLEPHRYNLFCMEADPRVDDKPFITTMSEEEADKIVRQPVDRLMISVDMEAKPFPSDEEE